MTATPCMWQRACICWLRHTLQHADTHTAHSHTQQHERDLSRSHRNLCVLFHKHSANYHRCLSLRAPGAGEGDAGEEEPDVDAASVVGAGDEDDAVDAEASVGAGLVVLVASVGVVPLEALAAGVVAPGREAAPGAAGRPAASAPGAATAPGAAAAPGISLRPDMPGATGRPMLWLRASCGGKRDEEAQREGGCSRARRAAETESVCQCSTGRAAKLWLCSDSRLYGVSPPAHTSVVHNIARTHQFSHSHHKPTTLHTPPHRPYSPTRCMPQHRG